MRTEASARRLKVRFRCERLSLRPYRGLPVDVSRYHRGASRGESLSLACLCGCLCTWRMWQSGRVDHARIRRQSTAHAISSSTDAHSIDAITSAARFAATSVSGLGVRGLRRRRPARPGNGPAAALRLRSEHARRERSRARRVNSAAAASARAPRGGGARPAPRPRRGGGGRSDGRATSARENPQGRRPTRTRGGAHRSRSDAPSPCAKPGRAWRVERDVVESAREEAETGPRRPCKMWPCRRPDVSRRGTM